MKSKKAYENGMEICSVAGWNIYELIDEQGGGAYIINENFLEEHKKSMEKICAGLNIYEKRKVALMCLERQFKAYQQLAKDKQWNRSEEYRGILDTCWEALLDGKELKEDIWEKHERIKPSSVNNTTKVYAETEFAFGNIFSGNMEDFLEMLLDDTGGEVSFCLYNIDFILNYSNEDNVIQDKNVTSECIKREVENQSNDVVQQKSLKNLIDVQNWYERTDNLIEKQRGDAMSFRFDGQEDALVLLDKMVITQLTEELLYLLDIFIDVDGKSELIYDFSGENWEDVRIRETKKLADFCNSGKMSIWLTDDTEKEYQVKTSAGIENFHRAIYAPSGNLLFVSASELIQCALYPEMEMDLLYEFRVQEGWYEISDIKNGVIEYHGCEKYKDKKMIKNL